MHATPARREQRKASLAIVVMDNLSAHIGPKVRQAIQARVCQLLFLPSYSPDLSPIEEAFSKLKTFLRQIGARTRRDLYEALSQALEAITPHDALGWFSPLNRRNHEHSIVLLSALVINGLEQS